jgi:Putative metal-binding motif
MSLGLAWMLLAGCPSADPNETDTTSKSSTADQDGDSFSVGQGDCDDQVPTINPLATDIVGDGVDQNCYGVDGTDSDADGFASEASGGDDCDDQLTAVNPAQTDLVGDGIDQNCDGVDGTDSDGDGFASEVSGGLDCDDAAATVNPAQADSVGDEVDQDCDGVDGVDADLDGSASTASGGDDCDDAQVGVNPDASDGVGDGVDQNCDAVDGVDEDRDGQASLASGGVDCGDLDPLVGAGFADVVGDSVDQSCDGVDGMDEDRDGFASSASGGLDCDDSSPLISPIAADTVGDGVDQNCDQLDGVDFDGDGFASLASGGADCADDDVLVTPVDGDLDGVSVCDGDCDDADPDRFPANPEVCNAVDDDCDAVADFALGVDACARQDVEVAGAGALDVLFVIDDSCSMAAKQGLLADGVDEFLGELVGNTDLHVGVVTTDMDGMSKRGQLQPGPDGATYLDDTYDLATATGWLAMVAEPGTTGSANERPLDASYTALALIDDTANAGFSRPEADTAVIFVTDEPDFSVDITPADWEAWFATYKSTVSVHAFASPQNSCGSAWVAYSEAVLDLVVAFGGTAVSICDPSWAGDLAAIAEAILPSPVFDGEIVLTEVPDPATISVEAEEPGGPVVLLVAGTDYVYDAALNAVLFVAYAPPTGTTLTISYRAAP